MMAPQRVSTNCAKPCSRHAGLIFRITRGRGHQHADPPHALALLRPRREGARSGATERRGGTDRRPFVR
jgi:hypothetical protein